MTCKRIPHPRRRLYPQRPNNQKRLVYINTLILTTNLLVSISKRKERGQGIGYTPRQEGLIPTRCSPRERYECHSGGGDVVNIVILVRRLDLCRDGLWPIVRRGRRGML